MTPYGRVMIVKTFLMLQLIYHVNGLYINYSSFPKVQQNLTTLYGQIKSTSLKRKYYTLLKRWDELM